MPTRSATSQPRSPTAAHVVRVWRELLGRRDRIKADALAEARDAEQRSPRALTTKGLERVANEKPPKRAGTSSTGAQERLRDLDQELSVIASHLRGWKRLADLERPGRPYAPLRERSRNEAAEIVRLTRLAKQTWYFGGAGDEIERQAERLCAPWRTIARARPVLVAGTRKRTPGATPALLALDASLTKFAETSRIWKDVTSLHVRFVKGHVRHAQQLAVQLLLEEMHLAFEAIPALLRGKRPTPLPDTFVEQVCDAARRYGVHSQASARRRNLAFLSAHAADIKNLSRVLRREAVTIQDALLASDVQQALGADGPLAAQRALAILDIVKPRTTQRLLAISGANSPPR